MTKAREILKQYWHFDQFRPLQEDIVNAALEGKDVLALLPTGGGKSICFQVPSMAQDGCSIVISPLIALMTDQVENLKKRGISAIAINSSLDSNQRELALHNAANGYYKFIYLSPESLESERLLHRLSFVRVNQIVVDEAHCISQWGYDFRPAYLNISKLRDLFPEIPCLALTATATEAVALDIQEKLKFKEAAPFFRKSFERPELAYNVLHIEAKSERLLELLRKIPGSALVYLRNRKATVEIARWLMDMGVSADYYHAGLALEERQQKQTKWINGKTRLMVCTNAFGMGIDKADVRLVIHLDLPDSLEAYFQEAGRAARDGRKAFSFVLVGPHDAELLRKKHLEGFPEREEVTRVYRALLNYLQIGIGSAEGSSYDFDLEMFAKQYRLKSGRVYRCLQILQKEGIIELNEKGQYFSRLFLKADRRTLYDYQLRNPELDRLLKVLMRSYGGMDLDYVRIQENTLAARLDTSTYKIKQALRHLANHGLAEYQEASEKSKIILLKERQDFSNLQLSEAHLERRKAEIEYRIEAVLKFIANDGTCRLKKLLAYFGERKTDDCGQCDVCRRRKQKSSLDSYRKEIKEILKGKPLELRNLADQFENKVLFSEALRRCLELEEISQKGSTLYLKGPSE